MITITIPAPHVEFGPDGIPAALADADYLEHAAASLRDGYRVGGSNVTATVVKLLTDAAFAIRTSYETNERFRADPAAGLERNRANLETGLGHANRIVDAIRNLNQVAARDAGNDLVTGFIKTLDPDAVEQLLVNALTAAAQLQQQQARVPMTHTPEGGPSALLAIGDQVEEILRRSTYPIAGFVIFAQDGAVEYRSPYPRELMRTRLASAADAL